VVASAPFNQVSKRDPIIKSTGLGTDSSQLVCDDREIRREEVLGASGGRSGRGSKSAGDEDERETGRGQHDGQVQMSGFAKVREKNDARTRDNATTTGYGRRGCDSIDGGSVVL
jgi:hypothetical protein